jgi:hypothetical protein
MTMPTYLPLYSKGAAPSWASDPSCVFALGLNKDGPAFRSDDMYGHPCTKAGALWSPNGFYSDGADDYISANPTPIMNFVTSNFSSCIWLLSLYTGAAKNEMIISRGSYGIDGWTFITYSGAFYFKVHQASPAQKFAGTATTCREVGKWMFISFVRIGTRGYIYKNGIDVTAYSETLYDPTPTNRSFILSFPSPFSFYGYIALPAIYSRALSPFDIRTIFESQRSIFGV